jgi:peptidoglycan/LPS O-acetylase OafA/YrhL
VTVGQALANLFLVHAFVPSVAVYYSLNSVSWSLSCEAFFYALFRPIRRVVEAVPAGSLLPLMVLGVGADLAVLGAIRVVGPNHAAWWGYISPLFRIIEFVLGVLLARLVRMGRWPRMRFGAALALAGIAYVAAGFAGFPFEATGITLVPFILLVGAAAHHDVGGRPSRWSSAPARWLGERSFAFYMVHQLVVRVADHERFARGAGAVGQLLAVLALLSASVLLADVLHRLVERPVAQAVRGLVASVPGAA